MNNLLLMLLICCGIYTQDDKPISSIWRLNMNDEIIKNEEEHLLPSKNLGIIPFYWKEISYTTLDSMLDKSQAYDSIMALWGKRVIDYSPEPIKGIVHEIVIDYGHKETVILDSCSYEVCVFHTSEGDDSHSYDDVKFFYIKNVGIVGAVQIKNRVPSPSWKRYMLTDLKNKKGKSIVNKKCLKLFTTNP